VATAEISERNAEIRERNFRNRPTRELERDMVQYREVAPTLETDTADILLRLAEIAEDELNSRPYGA
jgi:hypothetical protein